jgi:SAM-dependent methyltransferase
LNFSLDVTVTQAIFAPMTDSMTVFDRALLSRRRERARPGYADFAFLEEEVADRTADRLLDINRRFDLALELGMRSGAFARLVRAGGRVGTLISGDLAPGWAIQGRAEGATLALDEELLPYAERSADAVLSNLALYWVNDLPGTLSQIRRVLKPDGLFLASILGGETLVELRDALAAAEVEITGGLSPRVSPFADVRDAGGLLQRAGFALPVVDSEILTVTYETAFHLMRDLKGMGESNVVLERSRAPGRRRLFTRAAEIYAERFAGPDGRIPARFQIITLTAWAPAPTQQKPLRPGSASARLSEALGSSEIGTGDKPG